MFCRNIRQYEERQGKMEKDAVQWARGVMFGEGGQGGGETLEIMAVIMS